MAQDTSFDKKRSLNFRGRLLEWRDPQVMGILNCTPDSFYAPSRVGVNNAMDAACRMANEGAAMLDLGAQSTRPGAETVDAATEWKRLQPVLTALRKALPEIILSVDTFYASVADNALQEGADMINDVSGGDWDEELHTVVGKYSAPYVLMHAKGRPGTMQQHPAYDDILEEVMLYFSGHLASLRARGICDVVIDPGFGFGKSVEHNFTLLRHLQEFRAFGCPLMAGLSRKSMICKTLNIAPSEALNGTTVLHTVALINGVDILRVHDVKEAMEVIKLVRTVGSRQ